MDGTLLFESMPLSGETRFVVSGSGTAKLADGRQLIVYTWTDPMRENEISRLFMKHALAGLIVLNLCIFTIVAVMMYLLVLSPIISLRRTIREYYELGAMPQLSPRKDEIGRLHNTFVTMVGVLENKEQTERRLIASVSHDIKTPLTSVMGYSERLLSAKLNAEKQKQYLHSIYDKALVIKTVVDEFDEFLEAGFQDGAPMDLMSVGDFCSRIREEYQNELLDAGVSFKIENTCPTAQIRCNLDHLRRVFGNLIGNSIQHSDANPLILCLTCTREEDQAVFSFCDNGKGVAPELLGQIFEPFFTTDRGRKVSGLGLAICRNIIRAHGGSIRAENLPSAGLRIEIRLPLTE
ncbi:Adaptive-response sensory-kinase SasA [bioreactor metagenome]|uniref:histidine kinase n=1 Tax=bioreactor metagenome TaxID=1076179 RepID=A0A645ADZ2_9ZZZZ